MRPGGFVVVFHFVEVLLCGCGTAEQLWGLARGCVGGFWWMGTYGEGAGEVACHCPLPSSVESGESLVSY